MKTIFLTNLQSAQMPHLLYPTCLLADKLELDKFQVFHFVVTFMCVQLINTAIDFSTTTVIWIHLYLFKQA